MFFSYFQGINNYAEKAVFEHVLLTGSREKVCELAHMGLWFTPVVITGPELQLSSTSSIIVGFLASLSPHLFHEELLL